MKHPPLRPIIAAIGCLAAIACDNNGNFIGSGEPTPIPPTSVGVQIQPRGVEAVPGETRQFVLNVIGSPIGGLAMTWSRTPGVLSFEGVAAGVSAAVRCETLGSGTVSVMVGGPNIQPTSDTVSMTCIDPVRFTTALTAEHTVGKTVCPQVIGNIVLTNVSGRPVSVTARSENKAVEVTPGEATVDPSADQSFKVIFNCGSNPPVKTRIVFTVSVGGVQLTYASDVTINAGK